MGGWYRQVKQSLVDVESMFEIWNVKSNTDEDHQKYFLSLKKSFIYNYIFNNQFKT
jgi:ABC-type transport system involved in Fe-S cluster assembly fused permease/ATPase subunit